MTKNLGRTSTRRAKTSERKEKNSGTVEELKSLRETILLLQIELAAVSSHNERIADLETIIKKYQIENRNLQEENKKLEARIQTLCNVVTLH